MKKAIMFLVLSLALPLRAQAVSPFVRAQLDKLGPKALAWGDAKIWRGDTRSWVAYEETSPTGARTVVVVDAVLTERELDRGMNDLWDTIAWCREVECTKEGRDAHPPTLSDATEGLSIEIISVSDGMDWRRPTLSAGNGDTLISMPSSRAQFEAQCREQYPDGFAPMMGVGDDGASLEVIRCTPCAIRARDDETVDVLSLISDEYPFVEIVIRGYAR